jgi:hypothetical protein
MHQRRFIDYKKTTLRRVDSKGRLYTCESEDKCSAPCAKFCCELKTVLKIRAICKRKEKVKMYKTCMNCCFLKFQLFLAQIIYFRTLKQKDWAGRHLGL